MNDLFHPYFPARQFGLSADMNQISSLLSADDIILDLEASSKKRVFEHVGLLFENNHGIARSVVFDSLFEREKLGSTGLGKGVAIPHGRIKGLRLARAAFIRLATPVPFDSPDSIPVSLLFVLLVPEQATEHHLQILSELAERFSDFACRDALKTATSAESVRELFHSGRIAAAH